jgi:hypothetical protein
MYQALRERDLYWDQLRGVPTCQRCRWWPSDVTAALILFVCACVSMMYTIHLFLPSPLFLTPPALRFRSLMPLTLSASPLYSRGFLLVSSTSNHPNATLWLPLLRVLLHRRRRRRLLLRLERRMRMRILLILIRV